MEPNTRMKIYTVVLVYLDNCDSGLRVYPKSVAAYEPGRAIDIVKREMMSWNNGVGRALRKKPHLFDDEFMVFEGEYPLLPGPEPDEGHEDWREIEAAHGVYDPEAWQCDVEHEGDAPGELVAEIDGFSIHVGDLVVVRSHDNGKAVTVTVDVVDPEGDALFLHEGKAVSIRELGTVIAVHLNG